MLLIQAMIAAAKADGAVDATECQRILAMLEERVWVMSEMAKSLDIDPLVVRAEGLRLALKAYVASLMAIEVDTDEERRYLVDLRDRLRIDPTTAASLHNVVGVPAI